MTHSGTGPQQFVVGPPTGENVTIVFPDTSGYLISEADYREFKSMLAWWRDRHNITEGRVLMEPIP